VLLPEDIYRAYNEIHTFIFNWNPSRNFSKNFPDCSKEYFRRRRRTRLGVEDLRRMFLPQLIQFISELLCPGVRLLALGRLV
jgi:hypothetical protein